MRFASMLVLPLALSACEQAKSAPVKETAPGLAAAVQAKTAKIVFIDKENACDCTQKRIDATWAALQAALGPSPSLPVERIHLDTQAARADSFTLLKPLMVPPGIYFLDDRNGLIEMLQGEVSQEQIAANLK